MTFERVGGVADRGTKRRMFTGAHGRLRTVPATGLPPFFDGAVANLYEAMGEENEVSGMGAGLEGTKTNRTWQCNPTTFADLVSAFSLILGKCAYGAGGQPRLHRTLPLADPVAPWAYASTIPSIKGFGTGTITPADGTLETAPFPYSALWEFYNIEVDSLSRPFPVIPDQSIMVRSGSWYPETAGGTTQVKGWQYALEQNRFCTATFAPQGEYVVLQNNQLKGNSNSSSGSTPPGPNEASIQTGPRVYLPNALYTVKWYYVPYRLVLSPNSYLERWRGRINQNTMTGPDGFSFPPGSLLYINYAVEIYTPPVNQVVSTTDGLGSLSVISTEKFVTITMTFLYTKRTLTGTVGVTPTNKNYVVGGHNLLPWSDTNFYYFNVLTGTQQSIFLSAPLETLFSDCDSQLPVPP